MNIEMTHVIILFPNRRIQAPHQLCIFVIFSAPPWQQQNHTILTHIKQFFSHVHNKTYFQIQPGSTRVCVCVCVGVVPVAKHHIMKVYIWNGDKMS